MMGAKSKMDGLRGIASEERERRELAEAECERLRGLLSKARDGLQEASRRIRCYALDRTSRLLADAFAASDPSIPEGGE